ncbi:MAG: class I adenylate-forming enzyme family protein [Nocardioidaceae bacterium]
MSATNLASLLETRAADSAAYPALFDGTGQLWTFEEVDLIAGGVAHALADLGVVAGDRVASYLTNGPAIAFVLFGCWKLGAIPVTISSLYNGSELGESLDKTKPGVLLVDDHSPEAVAAVSGRSGLVTRSMSGSLDGIERLDWSERARVSSPEVTPESEACILFTGGTTGRPKAVSVTHIGTFHSLSRLASVSKGDGEQAAAREGVPPNLIALPLFHGGGQHSLLFSFFVGRGVVVWERFEVDLLATLMERHRFDNFFFLPTMLFDIVHAERDLPFDGVKSVLVAGQALPWSVRKAFEERYRIPIIVNYGSTETGHIAGWNAKDMKAGRWKPGSAGKVYDGVELEIRDDDGNALPPGSEGEVVVRSDLTRGYVDDEKATSLLVRDGWVHTGDNGYVDDDGVLFLVGRKRDMIKCGGFQVWPEEIEDVLREHALVHDIRVLGMPDERLGEIPVAVVAREADDQVSDDELAAQLIVYSREHLAHFKAPRRVEFVPELERSATGKLSRAGVPASVAGGN